MVADNPGQWPIITEITTDLMYVRLHGHDQLYASGYSDRELDDWATKINSWTERGCDVYVYCDNDAKVRAPYDAMGLMDRLGLSAPTCARAFDAARIESKGAPAYPKELTYPCCRQALGGLGEVSPREGPETSVRDQLGPMSLETQAGQHRRIG